MSWVFNPFTGALDWDNSAAAIDACIKKDGTTTTTATIPFQFGWSVPNDVPCWIGSEGAYVKYYGPEESFPGLHWEAAGHNMSFYANNVEFTSSGTTRFIGNSAFSGRPSFDAGTLLASNQTAQFGDSSRYMQWVSASSRLETLATGASDTLRFGARSKSQIDLTDGQTFSANVTDVAGNAAYSLNQSTALTFQSLTANERRYLDFKEGSNRLLDVIPSAVPTAAGYKAACLRVRQINLRQDVAPNGTYLFQAADAFSISSNMTCITGMASLVPTTSGLFGAGLDFGLLVTNPPTGNWSKVSACRSFLGTPATGSFNPTANPANALEAYVTMSDIDTTELNVADLYWQHLGGYGTLGTVNTMKVRSNFGGQYGLCTNQRGIYVGDLVGTYAGTTNLTGIQIDAPSGTFTNSWSLNAGDDIQVASGKKMLYEGSATTKGDTYHTYNGGTLETYVDGIKVLSATSALVMAHVPTTGFGGAGSGWTEAEIDFGSTPQWSKQFTITDGTVSGTSKIIVNQSGNVATGRAGDDAEWDGIIYAAKAGTGNFTLTALANPGPVVGKRKLFYQVS